MNEKEKLIVMGMDMLLKKLNKYADDKTFTVKEIIEISNEVHQEIMKGVQR